MFLILPIAYDREKAQPTVAGPMSLAKSNSYNMHVAKSGVAANTKDQFAKKKSPEAFFLRVSYIDYVDALSIDIKGYVLITLNQKTIKGYSDISGTHSFNNAL